MLLETTPVRAVAGMPDEVLSALHAAEAALVATPHPSPVHGTLAQWAEVVAVAQRVVNRAVAVQDEGMVALAAIEAEVLDDGTVVESHRAPGHVALDAPAIVSGALSVTSKHAEHRVRSAVRLAADGPTGSATATGLAGLHAAMRRGDLDAYRAGVVAEELEQAPPEVAAAVVQALATHADHETGRSCAAGAGGCWPRSAPTWSASGRPERVSGAACGGGPRSRASTSGKAPFPARMPPTPGPPSTPARSSSGPTAPAPASSGPAPRHSSTWSPAPPPSPRSSPSPSQPRRGRCQARQMDPVGPPTLTRTTHPTARHPTDRAARPRTHPATAHPARPRARGARVRPHLLWAARRGMSATALRPAPRSPEDLIEVAMGTRGERVLVTRAFLDVVTAGVEPRPTSDLPPR